MSTATATFRAVADFSDLRRQASGLNQEFNRLGQQKLGSGMSKGLGEVGKASDTANKSLSHLSRSGIPHVDRSLGKASTVAQGAQKAFQGVSQAAGNMLGNISPAAGAAGSLAASLGTVGSAAAVATVSVGALAAGVAAVGLAFNAQREQALIAFTTILKDGKKAEDVIDRITKTAAATPFETSNLIDSVRKLTAYGFDIERVLSGAGEHATGLVVTIGNAVAAVGGSQEVFQRVTVALGQMKTRGKIAGDELRQLAENGIPVYEILKEELNLTSKEVANIGDMGISATEGIDALARGLDKRFGGAMQAQSKTMIGLLSTLKDNFQLLAGAATLGLFDKLKGALVGIGDVLSAMTADTQEFGFLRAIEMRSPAAAVAIEALGRVFGTLMLIVRNLEPVFRTFSEIMSKTTLAALTVGLQGAALAFGAIASVIGVIPEPMLKIVGALVAMSVVSKRVTILTTFFAGLAQTISVVLLPKLLATTTAVAAIGTTEVGTNVAKGLSGIGSAAGNAVGGLSKLSLGLTGLSLGPLAAVAAIGLAVTGLIAALKAANDPYITSGKAAEGLAKSLELELNPELVNVATEAGAAASAVEGFGEAATEVSLEQFVAQNRDLIEQLRDITTELGKEAGEAYLIQVGVSLVLQGATPEEALAAIKKTAEAAGGVEVPVHIGAEDLAQVETVFDNVRATAARAVAEIEGMGNLASGGVRRAHDAVEELGSQLELLFKSGREKETIAAFAAFETAVRASGLSVREQDVLVNDAIDAMIGLDAAQSQSLEHTSDLTEYLRELATSASGVSAPMKEFATEILAGVDSGISFQDAYEAAGGTLRDFTAAEEESAEATEDSTDKTEDNTKALDAQQLALEQDVEKRQEQATQIGETVAALEKEEGALRAEIDALLAMNDARRSGVDATFALHEAEAAFAKSNADVGTSLEENKEGLYGVRAIYEGIAQEALAVADANVRLAMESATAKGAVLSATEALGIQNLTLIGMAQSAVPEANAAIGEMIVQLNGIPEERKTEFLLALASGDLATVQTVIEETSAAREVTITADAKVDEANLLLTEITAVRFAEILAEAFTEAAQTALDDLMDLRNAPVVANAETSAAWQKLLGLEDNAGRGWHPPMVATADTTVARTGLQNTATPGGKWWKAPFFTTLDNRATNEALTSMENRVRTVRVRTVGNIPVADGAILSFRQGGSHNYPVPNVNKTVPALARFLPKQAKIQPPGTLVQWAEPETGGEAFIPLAASKRSRSVKIWQETGRRLGQMADGGIRSFAEGDVPDLYAQQKADLRYLSQLMEFGWGDTSAGGHVEFNLRRIQLEVPAWSDEWIDATRQLLALEKQRQEVQSRQADVDRANAELAAKYAQEAIVRARALQLVGGSVSTSAAEGYASGATNIANMRTDNISRANLTQFSAATGGELEHIRKLTGEIQRLEAIGLVWSNEWVEVTKMRSDALARFGNEVKNTGDKLKDLVNKEQALVADRTKLNADYAKDRAVRDKRYVEQALALEERLTEAIKQRSDDALTSLDASERFTAGWATSAAAMVRNLQSQNVALSEFKSGMEALRARGVSQDVLDVFGISDVKDLAKVQSLLKATPAQLAQITAEVAARRATADQLASAGAGDLREAHAEALADLNLAKNLADAEALTQLYTDVQEINSAISKLGFEAGVNYSQAMAAGMSSGSTAIQQMAREYFAQLNKLREAAGMVPWDFATYNFGSTVYTGAGGTYHTGGIAKGRGEEVLAKLQPGEGIIAKDVMRDLTTGVAWRQVATSNVNSMSSTVLGTKASGEEHVSDTYVHVYLDSQEISAKVIRTSKKVARRETIHAGVHAVG